MIAGKTSKILFVSFGMLFLAKKAKILSKILSRLANKIYRNHPSLTKRVEPIIGTDFLIKITDAPFNILLTVGTKNLGVVCLSKREIRAATLSVSGKFFDLLKIFEGNEDSDALFFSRKLKIDGNMQALVCLRNAIDNENISLIDEIFPKSLSKIFCLRSKFE